MATAHAADMAARSGLCESGFVADRVQDERQCRDDAAASVLRVWRCNYQSLGQR